MDPESRKRPKFAQRRPDWALPKLDLELQLHPDEALDMNRKRQLCPKCGRSRSLFCYDCLIPFTEVPRVDLPFHFSIITHHEEARSKNTGVQVAVLAPDRISLHSIDECPEFSASRAIVLFPCDEAIPAEEVDTTDLDRVFIIDSKWKKAGELVQHPALQGVKRVKLRHTQSCFWRFHTRGVAEEGVSTAEAIYHFLKAVHNQSWLRSHPQYEDPHCFDNVLWYFAFQHKIVEGAMEVRNKRHRLAEGALGGCDQRLGQEEEGQGVEG